MIHRDIKPANIIVGKHGETLVVDWGLAKAIGRADPSAGEQTLVPSSGGSSETLPGSALGTPAYMSPEQACGDLDRLGPRSDVYSLGATLYCLLTGKPPFEGDDIGVILRAVQQGDFLRPAQLDPSIDKALEAICLKAMAHEARGPLPNAEGPGRRHRAVDGRRAGHRLARADLAAGAAVGEAEPDGGGVGGGGAVAGVVGLSAVLAVQTQAKAEVARALAARAERQPALAAANDELARSRAAVQARYDLAVEAIKTFHTGVSEDFLLKQDQFKELRDRLLRSAADFYGKLSALLGRETDPASRRALAAANFELAELTGKVGRQRGGAGGAPRGAGGAGGAGGGAGGRRRGDGRRRPEPDRGRRAAGGDGEDRRGAGGVPAVRVAAGGPAGDRPGGAGGAGGLPVAAGLPPVETGQTADALAAYRLARADQEALAAAPGAPAEARRDLADTVNRIGILLRQTGRPTEAEAEYRRALAIRQKLAADNPAVTEFRHRPGDSHNNLGVLLAQTGKPTEAEAEYRRALAIQQKLAADNPAVTEFRSGLAISHNNLGVLLTETGRPTEAEAEYRRALEIAAEAGRRQPRRHRVPQQPGGQPQQPRHRCCRRRASRRRRRPSTAGRWRSTRSWPPTTPPSPTSAVDLASSHHNLGVLLAQTGQPTEAEAEFRRALEILQKLAADNPKVPDHRFWASQSQTGLSAVLRRLGRPAEAKDGGDRAVAIGEALVQELPTVSLYRGGLAGSYCRRSLARGHLGDPAGAAADARRAIALWDGLSPTDFEEWFGIACAHAALAGLAGRAGSGVSAAEALSDADAAMALIRNAIEMGNRTVSIYRTEDALDPLRSRDDFRMLMMDLEFPSEPFAPDMGARR